MYVLLACLFLLSLAALTVWPRGAAANGAEDAEQRQGNLLEAANAAALLLLSDEEDLEELARRALQAVGRATGADRVDVWRNHGSSRDGLLCTKVYNWNSDNATNYTSAYTNTVIYASDLPGWEDELGAGRSIDTGKRDLSAQERQHLEHQMLGAAFVVPILFRTEFWGFIRLGARDKAHGFGQEEERVLISVGLLLAATMQRRQIQHELAESEQRFRDVAAAAGEIVWELDAQGYCSFMSARVFEMTGYAVREMPGKRWEDLAYDLAEEEITGRMFQAGLETGSFRGIEHRIKSKDGKLIWLLSSGKLLTGPEGIAGLRGISMDITRDREITQNLNTTLKALEIANRELETSAERAFDLARKAESANQAKSDFLANISHEIRTPLNAVIGMAYLMRKTPLSPRQEDYINKIHTAGQTLLGVVNDILDFSKIESGRLEIEHAPFQLGVLLENVSSLLGAKIEEKGLAAAFTIDRNVPLHLIGDQLRLGQVLSNLAGNAVKFTETGGISVRCSLEKMEGRRAHLRFAIRDTGIGIAKAQQEKLFHSFSQVDGSITRKYGGTGLGLAIAKSTLELAGGHLSLESTEGKGTLVTIRIAFEVNTDVVNDATADDALLAGLPVMLVNVEDMQRALLQEVLQDMGCRVSAFSDTGQAFAALDGADSSATPFRVILLPLPLALDGRGRNLRHITDVMRLAHPPQVICIAPFGHMEPPENDGQADLYHRIAAMVQRPVLSSALRDAVLSTLPERQGVSGSRKVSSGPAAAPYFPESRVLLVEDNPVNQEIAGELFHESGISVTLAENGLQALDILDNNVGPPFDIVFMDLQMPEMDGFTATERLRADPRFKTLPVVAMTAHATVEERQHCLAVGMNEHISKPIDVAVLHDTLRRWLKPVQQKILLIRANPLDDAPLPELPGLRAEEALVALEGDILAYKTLLLEFFLRFSGAEKEIAAAFAARDSAAALRLFDLMSAQAGSIGALRLRGMAERLRDEVARAGNGDEPKEVQNFLVELAAVAGMLGHLFPQPVSSAFPPDIASSSNLSLPQQLSALNALLADDDAESCRLFAELKPQLTAVDSEATAKADRALAVFDFAEALASLVPMENGLRSLQEQGQEQITGGRE